MAERIKIGIIFDNNPNWTGGTYYILNLIHALNTLDDAKKPTIVLFTVNVEDFEIVRSTNYPFLNPYYFPENYQLNLSFLERAINKVARKLTGKNFIDHRPSAKTVTSIFPFNNWTYPFQHYFERIPTKICWIADFQEKFYPEFFSEKEIESRRNFQKKIVEANLDLVLSSQDSKKSFESIFPQHSNSIFVIPFAVTHPKFENLSFESLLLKFNLRQKYFFAPNQFWKHKNHRVILEALKIIKDSFPDILVAFSGKEIDSRNPDYFEGLKKFVSENQLDQQVKFLGFIDRSEQLCLMAHSIAVIQPSLFEGWSTVIEDAKAMNKSVIASNLEVHKEQLFDHSNFFDPKLSIELANLMLDFWQGKKAETFDKGTYKSNIKKFGEEFISIYSIKYKLN